MPFRIRSFKKEHLDNCDIPAEDLKQNLHELNIINNLLGGYKVSVNGLKKVIRSGNPVRTILDIGFGGGDSIRKLANMGLKSRQKIFFHGVDFKPECVAYAENNLSAFPDKKLHCIDYRKVPPALYKSVDVIHCSLFLHHLRNDEIVHLFRKALLHDCILVVNDLHRHWFAYYAIKTLTSLFSKSWLVKNDAPLSVKRGFFRKELEDMLQLAGFSKYEVRWRWAFRYQVIAYS